MGKKDNIEEIFKDAFESFEAPVDPSVWAGVQSGMSAGAGSAGAGATGASLTAKIIGFTVAAAVTTAVVVGIYQYTSTDDEPKHTEETKKELVEHTTNPDVDSKKPLIVEDQISDREIDQKEPKPTSSQDQPDTTKPEETKTSSSNVPVNSPDEQTDSNVSDNNSNTSSDDKVADKPDKSDKPDKANNKPPVKSADKPEKTPLKITARIENARGAAPLKVNMVGETNGKDLVWWVNYSEGKQILEGNEQSFTFNEPGNYLISVIGTNEAGEKEKQEFVVEVEPNVEISLKLEPALLGRDKGVILTPGGFDNQALKFIIENEDQFAFFKMAIVDANTQKIVFETSDISQRNWNGTNQYGEPLPASQNYYLTIFAGDKEGNTIEPIRKRLTIIR